MIDARCARPSRNKRNGEHYARVLKADSTGNIANIVALPASREGFPGREISQEGIRKETGKGPETDRKGNLSENKLSSEVRYLRKWLDGIAWQ